MKQRKKSGPPGGLLLWLFIGFLLVDWLPASILQPELQLVFKTILFLAALPLILSLISTILHIIYQLTSRRAYLMAAIPPLQTAVALESLLSAIPLVRQIRSQHNFDLAVMYLLDLKGADGEEVLKKELKLVDKSDTLHHAKLLGLLANAQGMQGKFKESEATTRKTLSMLESHESVDPSAVSGAYADMCATLTKQGQSKKAIEAGERAVRLLENSGDALSETLKEHQLMAHLNNLGCALDEFTLYTKAEIVYRRSLQLRKSMFGENHGRTAIGHSNVASALLGQHKYKEALEHAETAKRILDDVGQSGGGVYGCILLNLGDASRGVGDLEKSEKLLNDGLNLTTTHHGNTYPLLIEAYRDLGRLHRERGDFAESKRFFEKSIEMSRKTIGDDHPRAALVFDDYAKLLHDHGRETEGRDMDRRAAEIRAKHELS